MTTQETSDFKGTPVPTDKTQDELKAASEKAWADYAEVRAFTTAAFAQSIYGGIRAEVERSPSMRGKPSSVIDAEIQYHTDKEAAAIKGLSKEEAAVCKSMGVLPSDYVRNRDGSQT